MAVEYDPKSNRFQVDYQAPFGGLDSTAYASSIDPHNFAAMDSLFVESNILKPIKLTEAINNATVSGNYLGYIPVAFTSVFGLNITGYLVTDTTIYTVSIELGVVTLAVVDTYAPALPGNYYNFNYIVIDDIQSGQPTIFWTTNGWNEIWSYDSHTGATALTTNYVGGGILGLLNNQLMVFGGTSQLDGDVPNRISWSAPGQYGQFKPYDVGSGTGSYSAGFNDLPSTSDILTGFAAIGTVGYLFRTQGITQINPTGNGLVPFQFNHLWASELGVGSPYPNSIAQYGALVCFIAEDSLYTIGIGGLNKIGTAANDYLTKLITNSATTAGSGQRTTLTIHARVIPYLVNTSELMYVIALISPVTDTSSAWQFVAIDVATGVTYNLGNQLPFEAADDSQTWFSIQVSYVSQGNLLTSSPSNLKSVCLMVYQLIVGDTVVPKFYYFTYLNTGSVTFRKEIFKFGFVPTVSKIGLIASLIDSTEAGLISFSVDGGLTFNTAFPDLVLAASTPNGVLQTLFSDGVQSLERPQLALKLTNIQVAEVWYQGTLADYPLI